MRIKKIQFMFIVLLLFSLIITSCTAPRRPVPKNNDRSSQTDIGKRTNMIQSEVDESAKVDDKKTKDNIMPDAPRPVTPKSTAGFTLDQINKFDLNIKLTNDDKIDMKYIKGPFNKGSKIENVINGKTEKTEHEEASREIEKLLKKIPGASLSDTTKIIDGILAEFKIKRDNVVDFNMGFIFENGENVRIGFNKSRKNE